MAVPISLAWTGSIPCSQEPPSLGVLAFTPRSDSILEVFSNINDSVVRKTPKSGGSSSHHPSPHPSERGTSPEPLGSAAAPGNSAISGSSEFAQRLDLILEVFSSINDSVERKTPKGGGSSSHPSGRGTRPKQSDSAAAPGNYATSGSGDLCLSLELILEVFSNTNDYVEWKTPKRGGF